MNPAPPFRCHHCGVNETSHWRSSSKGPNTLCNPCYAHSLKWGSLDKRSKIPSSGAIRESSKPRKKKMKTMANQPNIADMFKRATKQSIQLHIDLNPIADSIKDEGLASLLTQRPPIFVGLTVMMTLIPKRPVVEGDLSKTHLEALVVRSGGVVRSEFPRSGRCILLASRPSRTLKYLSAIARGTPIVHFNWVRDSDAAGEALPWQRYLLPVGFSVLERQEVTLFDRFDLSPRPSRERCMWGHRIAVIGNEAFTAFWKEVLGEAGAVVNAGIRDEGTPPTTALCTADAAPGDLSKASGRGAQVVGSEWAIQSLFAGKVLDHYMHPTFDHVATE